MEYQFTITVQQSGHLLPLKLNLWKSCLNQWPQLHEPNPDLILCLNILFKQVLTVLGIQLHNLNHQIFRTIAFFLNLQVRFYIQLYRL